jgi:hypothetical protein
VEARRKPERIPGVHAKNDSVSEGISGVSPGRPLTQPTKRAHLYEVRLRKDHRGVDLISDALPFGRLWYGEPNAVSNAIGYAKFYSRSHRAVIRVYDAASNVIETHEHAGEFKEP